MKTKTKLTPADEKFIAKFFTIDFDAHKTHFRSNRFSGEKVEVDPISAAAIDFIFKLEGAINSQSDEAIAKVHPLLKRTNAISNFDRARMLVLKMNPEAYMAILD